MSGFLFLLFGFMFWGFYVFLVLCFGGGVLWFYGSLGFAATRLGFVTGAQSDTKAAYGLHGSDVLLNTIGICACFAWFVLTFWGPAERLLLKTKILN